MTPPEPSIFDNDDALHSLAWYAQRKPVYTGGNTVRLLRGGQALFPALIAQIDAAQRNIWLAMYIVSPIGQAGEVLQALMRAARRGVDVFLVADGFGSHDAPDTLWLELREAGVQLTRYRPIKRLWDVFDTRQWRRMHMKLCAIDEQIGFAGGINLIDDHYDLHHGWSDHPRLDYAVQVQGPAVSPMLHTIKAVWMRAKFGRDWRDDLAQLLQDPGRVRRLRGWIQSTRLRLSPREQNRLVVGAALRAPMRAAFVLRDNLRQRRTIERAALQALSAARHRIDIVTPYFYPRRAIRLALRHAAARGVKVRLLLQGKVDYPIAALAARVLYAELQQHGVRIHEYQPAFLHAKVLRVDDEWATVGSSNLDPLSLVLNLEANLIVRDRGFVRELSAMLDQDFVTSREVPRWQPHMAGAWHVNLGRRFVAACAKLYLWLARARGRY